MKILLFGKNGQIGWELQRSLAPLGEVVAPERSDTSLCGDLTDIKGLAQTVRSVSPDVIVNAAAYTAVDKAETDRDMAYLINAEAPGVLAREAQMLGAQMVHYSTDYVFDGSGSKSWTELAPPAPLNFYGSTKLDGEKKIQASGCKHLIFRTSWAYATRGNNFAKTMLRLAQERDKLSVVNDQIGAPTGAELIADVTALALRSTQSHTDAIGIYHLAADGEVSWHDYARFTLNFARQCGLSLKTPAEAIRPVASIDYPTPAKRPLNSRLNTEKLRKTFNIHIPDWRQGVRRMLAESL